MRLSLDKGCIKRTASGWPSVARELLPYRPPIPTYTTKDYMTVKELRENYEKAVAAIKDSCPHTEFETMPYMWAPGHITGMVQVCKYCEKILSEGITVGGGTVTVSPSESEPSLYRFRGNK